MEHPESAQWNRREQLAEVHRYGGCVVQAHPFRRPCIPANPTYLHGMEAFNINPRAVNNNDLTAAFVDQHPHLIRTSGSDFHRPEDLGGGSIRTHRDIRTSAEMAQCLRDGAFEMLVSE